MLHDVVRGIGNAMEQNAGPEGDRESRALREANRGVIVERFHPHDAEVRVLTVGGKAVVGATDSNWILMRSEPSSTEEWNQIGNTSSSEDWIRREGHWPSIVEWSESLASETDLLRVDFLVSRSGENSGENSGSCVASEMCAFLWPQSTFFNGAHERLEKMLLDHHDIQGLDYAEEAFFVAKGETMNPTA